MMIADSTSSSSFTVCFDHVNNRRWTYIKVQDFQSCSNMIQFWKQCLNRVAYTLVCECTVNMAVTVLLSDL